MLTDRRHASLVHSADVGVRNTRDAVGIAVERSIVDNLAARIAYVKNGRETKINADTA